MGMNNKKNIMYAISKRSDGTMKKNKLPNSENIATFLSTFGLSLDNAKCMKQVHGGDVAFVDENSPFITENVDSLVTNKKNNTLIVFTADCVPLIFFDEQNSIAAAVHAGYKGILNGVIENTIKKIKDLGGESNNIQVLVGPSIRECCYDVDSKRVKLFDLTYPEFTNMHSRRNGKYYLHLTEIAKQILISRGIYRKNILQTMECTKCNSQSYFSYRNDPKSSYGEFITTITLL